MSNNEEGSAEDHMIKVEALKAEERKFQHWNAMFTTCVDGTATSAQFGGLFSRQGFRNDLRFRVF